MIEVCKLEVVVMPNGEIICAGKTMGWVKDIGKYLTKSPMVTVGNDEYPFETFLKAKHANTYSGTDDAMSDAFDTFVERMDNEQIVYLGDQFGRTLIKQINEKYEPTK